MKKRYAILLGLLMTGILMPSCNKVNGEGPVVTEMRDITGFTGIDVGVSGTLKFTPDSVYKVEISAQRNILNIIEMPLTNGILRIGFKVNKHIRSNDPIVINIHAPNINTLGISGSANLTIDKPFYPEYLKMVIAGSGNIKTGTLGVTQDAAVSIAGSGSVFILDLQAESMKMEISGSGNVAVEDGHVDNEELHISGSGEVEFSGVAAQDAIIHSSGSGSVRLHITRNMEVHISGSGDIYYKGNPRVTTFISGSGKVIPL